MACLRYSVPISGLHSGRVRERPDSLTPAFSQARLIAQRVVEHRDAVEVAGLAQQLAAPVDHRLDVLVAQSGRLLDAPLEGLVVVADEFQVHADGDLAHKECGMWSGGDGVIV